MDPLDANTYRKQVLAVIEKRGGATTADPFEIYDLPLEDITDGQAVTRIDEVWAFWQRQRDHPKYRTLIENLLADHPARSAPLRTGSSRRELAVEVRQQREQRDTGRYQLLDVAISRLVERHGGIPRSKLAGLEEVGMMGGLTADEVTRRIRRHRFVDDPVTPPPAQVAPTETIGERRMQQIQASLQELARITDGTPIVSLFDLLHLDPVAAEDPHVLRQRAESLRTRARELAPGRMRAVLDELLIHVHDLLQSGPGFVAAYIAALVSQVGDQLRPRVRAALLIEDRLVDDDRDYLVDEAIAAGLDRRRAEQLVAALASEDVVATAPAPAAARPAPVPAAGRTAVPDPARAPEPTPPPGVPVPASVTAGRDGHGGVEVTWTPIDAAGATYKVTRQRADGSWQVLGRTGETSLTDGGAPAEGPVPVYGVEAIIDGASSEVRHSAAAPTAAPTAATPAPPTTPPPAQPTAPPPPAAPPVGADDFPVVTGLAVHEGILTFTWPPGVTEVKVACRADAPPHSADDASARVWKVTNTRYSIDGGVRLPAELGRPCHLAVVACRRTPTGALQVAPAIAEAARLNVV